MSANGTINVSESAALLRRSSLKSLRRRTRIGCIGARSFSLGERSFAKLTAGEVEEKGLKGGALAREKPRRQFLALGKCEEGTQRISRPRTEAVGALGRDEVAFGGEQRGERGGSRNCRKAD